MKKNRSLTHSLTWKRPISATLLFLSSLSRQMTRAGNFRPAPAPCRGGRRNPLIAAIVLLAVVVNVVVVIVPSTEAFDVDAVDEMLRAVQACRAESNPALAVTVVQDGRVVLSRGYGVTRLPGEGEEEEEENVTSSTRFNIASVTKGFTATLLLKVMEEDGRFNLSTKVREIMGEDFEFGDELRTREAMVEDLLSHKMAIPQNNRLRYDNNFTLASLKDRLKYLKSSTAFRNEYIYSNLMYGLAARLTEIIGGARWEDLVRRHLYRPLGMSRSTFVRDAISDRSGIARPYRQYFGTLKPVSPRLPFEWAELAGSGSVVTTADDMAKWLTFHLSKGQGPGGTRVMAEKTVEELYKPRTAMQKPIFSKFVQPDVPVSFTLDIYGMGFRTGYYRGYPIVGHGGSSYGFRSLLTLVPSQKLGIFTTMSGGDAGYRTRGTLHTYLMDRALGLTPWLNLSTICSFPAPWHNVTNATWPPYDAGKGLARDVSAYLGLYHHPAYGTFRVREWLPPPNRSVRDGWEPAAPLTLLYGYATWDLIPLPESGSSVPGEERFYGKGRNVSAWVDYSPFVFHAPPKGGKVVVELSAPGLEKQMPPVFTRVGYGTSGSSPSALGGGGFALRLLLLLLLVSSV